MAIPSVTNTSPITAEWLNTIVSTVNALTASVENTPKVTVSGLGINSSAVGGSDVLIVVGEQEVRLSENSATASVDVNFANNTLFLDDNITVTASIEYATGAINQMGPAALAIGGVSQSGFKLAVQRFDTGNALKKSETFKVKYIAIGKKKSV